MPAHVYTVEIDGHQYDLEGDHEPSEAEARSAIGGQAPKQAAPSAPVTTSAPTDIFHKTAGENIAGVAGGAWSRVKDIAKSLPVMALDPLGTETAKITGRGETNPLKATGNLAASTVTEPIRIGKQAGEGTPEAIGKSLVDTAAYIPTVLGLKRGAGPTARSVASATPRVVGGLARAIPDDALKVAGGMVGGYYGGMNGAVGGYLTGGLTGRAMGKLRKVGLSPKPPAVNPNAGGRLVAGSPSVPLNDSLLGALGELTRTDAPALAPSHPSGGGYTVPAPTPNAGGRLVAGASAQPSLSQTLQDALGATQEQPSGVRVGLGHPSGGGYTVPTEVPQPPVTYSPKATSVLAKMSKPGAVERAPSPTQMEQVYRELSRKPVLTPDETLVMTQLAAMMKDRASRVGMSFAAGGKSGVH